MYTNKTTSSGKNFWYLLSLQFFELYGEASKIDKVMPTESSEQFLNIISTSIHSDYLN